MKLTRLEFEGFRSFLAPAVLDFGAMAPGLYHVHGRNEIEPELEANGAGKTTLFEAVHWCLYGKTSRGVRGGSVRNWDATWQCAVATDWHLPEQNLSLLRTWGPNSLELITDEQRPVDQEKVDSILAPQAVYLFSSYFAQFAPTFVDLSPAEQSAMFTDVLGLHVWDNASMLAAEDVRKLEGMAQVASGSIAHTTGKLQELADTSYDEQEHWWEQQRLEDLQAAQSMYSIALDQETKARTALGAARVGAVTFRELKEKEADNSRTVGSLHSIVTKLVNELSALESKDYKNCPTCGSPVTNKHIKQEIEKKKAELEAAAVRRDKAMKKTEALLFDMGVYRDSALRETAAVAALATAQADVRAADAKCSDIESATNPYTKLRQDADRRGTALLEELERAETELKAVQAQAAVTGYWVKGFKEVRLMLINESLAQLTIEANEVLYQLGLKDWSIEFAVEKENKTGGISKHFNVLVRSPDTDQAPWEAWCGGEGQRLRIAIAMGFANLVASRTGMQGSVEFWDEPTNGLSPGGIQALLQVLADRAQRLGKIILLADHRSLEFGGFSGVITIVKDQNGSRIE